jgi:hypothetical protein
MTTFIDPFGQQEVISREMPPTLSAGISLFIGAFMTGFYLYDVYLKQKDNEKKLKEGAERITELEATQDLHDQTLQEHEIRFREKKDYDESEEVEEGRYQAWKGETSLANVHMFIKIVREKNSTVKKNQGWIDCTATEDGSCVVRDFYLGNSHPEFHWDVVSTETTFQANVSETMVNGWDSIVKLSIDVLSDNLSDLSSYLKKETDDVQVLCNAYLKKMIDSKLIDWSRILIQH